MFSAVCNNQERGGGDKGSTRRGRVKNWYAKKVMICEPSSVVTMYICIRIYI